jgi:hypothetical protein
LIDFGIVNYFSTAEMGSVTRNQKTIVNNEDGFGMSSLGLISRYYPGIYLNRQEAMKISILK